MPDEARSAGALRVLATLQARHDELARGMLDGIVGAIDPYAAGPEALRRDVLAHCGAHVRTFVAALQAGDAFDETDLTFVREATARRARQGVALESVLHAFRVGHRIVWDAIVDEAQRLPDGDEAAVALARPSMEYIDLVSTAVADTYLTEQQAATADLARGRRDALELVLAGRPLPDQRHSLHAPSLDPDGRYVVVVAAIAAGHEHPGIALSRAAEALAHAAGGDGAAPLVVVRHDEVVGLLAAQDGTGAQACAHVEEAQDRLAGEGISLLAGVGVVCHGLAEAPRAHAEAQDALGRATPDEPLFALPRMSPYEYLVATADETAVRTVPEPVSALVASTAPARTALVDTAFAFAACDGNVRRTAAALHAHPNTVHHRLGRLVELTGHDVHRADQLIDLLTSLRLLGARPSTGS